MPVTGGSMGGSDLDLVLKIVGFSDVAEKYQVLLEEVAAVKKEMSEAEVQAAEIFSEQAKQAAGAVVDAADVAKAGRVLGEQISTGTQEFMLQFGKIGDETYNLRKILNEMAGGASTTPAPKPTSGGRGKPGKHQLQSQITGFVNVGEQASQTMNRGLGMITSQMPFGIGGVVGLMLYGLAYEDKIRAETEGYKQLFESTVGATSVSGIHAAGAAAKRIADHIVGLTETFRMSKEEAGALVGAAVRAGIGAEELEKKTSVYVGKARGTVLDATAAIDQTLRLQSGTAMVTATKLVQNYGGTMSHAVEQVGRMATTAQNSGVGVQNFMNSALQSTGYLRQFGAGLDDAIRTTTALQEHLEKEGLGHHFAGVLAMTATGQIAGGMAGMGKSMQMLFAQRRLGGSPEEAYFRMQDAYLTGKVNIQNDVLIDLIGMLSSSGDATRAETATVLRQMTGVDAATAGIMVDSVGVLKDLNSTKEQKNKAQKEFADTFARERSRTEDWRVTFKDLMRGMSKLGLGLFGVLTSGLAQLVIIFKLVPLYMVDFIGNLAKSWGVDIRRAPGPLQDVIRWMGNANIGGVPAFGLASIAAKGLIQGGLSASDSKEKERLTGLFDQATAASDAGAVMSRTGLSDMLKALKQGGRGMSQDFPGVEALFGAIGTPEAMRQGAAAMSSQLGGVEDFVRGAGLRGRGGGTVDATLGAGDVVALTSARSRGDLAGVQERLLSAASETTSFASSQWDASKIVVTNVDFRPNSDGSATVHISFAQTESGSAADAIRAASARPRNMQRFTSSDSRSAIDQMLASNPDIPRAFAYGMAQLESGFNPGTVGDPHIQQRSVGLYQINRRMLEKELRDNPTGQVARIVQQETGGAVPTNEQLADPYFNARLWAPLARGYLGRARRNKAELKKMGRTEFEGARMAAAGLPMTAEVVQDPMHRRNAAETEALIKSHWRPAFERYQ